MAFIVTQAAVATRTTTRSTLAKSSRAPGSLRPRCAARRADTSRLRCCAEAPPAAGEEAAVPEAEVTEAAVPEEVVAEAAAPEEVVAEAAASEEVVVEAAAPEEVVAEAAAPEVEATLAPAPQMKEGAAEEDAPAEETAEASEGQEEEHDDEAQKGWRGKDKRRGASRREVTLQVSDLVVGNEYEGTVRTTTNYGAFVDIGTPTDGLLHVSQLADRFVKSVTDIVKEGDVIMPRIISVDVEKGEFGLSLKPKRESGDGKGDGDESRSPRIKWTDFKYEPEQFVEGTVVSTTTYGAFIDVGAPTDGMCHISEMSDGRTESVEDVMKVGDKVQVRVVNADSKRNRISLSLKQYEIPAKESLKEDLEAAAASQPEFKTSMELAFERARKPE